jgi:hypothetical protein
VLLVIIFEFQEVDQTRGESQEMALGSELGNGCKYSLSHYREILDHVLQVSGVPRNFFRGGVQQFN